MKRQELIAALERSSCSDVLIIGGGIHDAAFARLAAFNGLNTVLLEKTDYASGTSSRSSKMAHGGLRYLEMFDLRQVLEGIKAREDLFAIAPDLVKPCPFLIPIFKKQRFSKWKLGLGLYIYDLMVRRKERRHRWIPLADPNFTALNLEGCYLYYDGLMNDSRLVIAHIFSARQEGAVCLNYASAETIQRLKNGRLRVTWLDRLTGEKREIETRIVINCAGPWAPLITKLSLKVRYSQGSHLLFNQPWSGPALFLPLAERGRYYFVWPHFAGTLVGTTEREVTTLEDDPKPSRDEIDEILARLAKDLPHSGLNRGSLHYCFAGIRTLPVRDGAGATSAISRRHIWSYADGILSLLGGKYTTAAWTVMQGLKIVFKVLNFRYSPLSLRGWKLPSAEAAAPTTDLSWTKKTELALDVEQAETLEDIMRRRLDVEYLPGHGFEILPEVLRVLGEQRPALDLKKEEERYRARIGEIKKLVRGLTQLPLQSQKIRA